VKFHQILRASFYEPRKLAAFRLLPIGKVFTYIFIFVSFFTLISFIRYSVGETTLFERSPELIEHGETIGWLIYPIAFLLQLVISTFYIFIRISLFAYAGTFILKVMKRRGDFLHIWRTSAIALTVPFLFTIAFDFFPGMNSFSTLITSIIHIGYIAFAAKYYPKQPQ
jgi:hypothetical protein